MIPPARGGVGGGAIQLSVNGTLSVGPRGVINLSGAGGAGGTDVGSGNRVAGGGGGSGGALLIEALELEVAAGARIVANGGGGGSGARYTTVRDSQPGEPGAPGYPRDDWDSAPAPGGESVGDGSGRGGTGAAGMQTNGTDGQGIDWLFGGNGGGGGGGAGCLQYRVPAGAAQISGSARISPSFTTMPPEFR